MEVGDKINRLTLIKKCKGVKSLFKCDCGNEKMINIYNVEIGKTKSCGCLFKEHPNHTKHGDRWTRLYRIWRGMRERCNTPSCSTYKNYGARGITVCDEWNNYETFKKWALKNGYNDKLTIDRVNVNVIIMKLILILQLIMKEKQKLILRLEKLLLIQILIICLIILVKMLVVFSF